MNYKHEMKICANCIKTLFKIFTEPELFLLALLSFRL